MPFSRSLDSFDVGALAALSTFKEELIAHRGLIENEDAPAFDVVLDLLNRTIGALVEAAGAED